MIKKIFWPLLAIGVIALGGCKKDNGGSVAANETAEKLATMLSIHSGASKAYADEYSISGDSIDALDAMGQYIANEDAVKEAFYIGNDAIEIYYNNGLRSSILLTPVDADGNHLTRGGGGNKFTTFKNSATPTKIKNEKALVLVPFVDQFYYGSYDKESMFELGGVPMEVDVLEGADVTLNKVNSMSDYGFIILNTHGLTYGFILYTFVAEPQEPTGEKWTTEEALAVLGDHTDLPVEKFENGELEIGMNMIYARGSNEAKHHMVFVVTEKYIRNAALDLTDAVVFGNFCYSGYTLDGPTKNNLSEAFKSKGVGTYYGYAYENGYSVPVDDAFAKQMEDSLIINLTNETDTTGAAHLAANATRQFYRPIINEIQRQKIERGKRMLMVSTRPPDPEFYFTKFFDGNYAYDVCQDTMVDSRDGQVYKTTCIGGKVWFAENLNYAGEGECYEYDAANCDTYGRLYNRNELTGGMFSSAAPSGVEGICPPGWHVPSKAEWNELITNCCGTIALAAFELRSPTGWSASGGTNKHGFNMLAAGEHYYSLVDTFERKGVAAHYWTTDPEVNSEITALWVYGNTMYFNELAIGNGSRYRYSCRCVKN